MKLQELREKYPMYDVLPDDLLRAKVNAKYPGLLDDMPNPELEKQNLGIQQQQLNIQRAQQEIDQNKPSNFLPSIGGAAVPAKPPLSTFILTPDKVNQPASSKSTTSPSFDINAIEEARRQDYIKFPNQRTAVDAYYDSLLNEYKMTNPEKTADQLKRENAKNDAERLMTQLENLYYGKKGTKDDLSKGRIAGLGAGLMSALGANQPLRTYSDARTSARATLARAFGDVGNLSKSEQENAIKLLPTARSTPEEAAAGFKALREKLGLTESNIKVSPKNKTENPLYNAIESVPGANFLLGGAQRVAQDVGTGIKSKMAQPQFKEMEKQALQLETQSKNETNPGTKKLLLQQANQIRSKISKQAGDISQNFTEDVSENPIIRGGSAGAGIAGTAELAGAIPAITSSIKGFTTKGLPSITSKGAAQGRSQIAKETTATFKGKDFVKVLDEYEKADPLSKTVVSKLKQSLANKELTAKELIDKMNIWSKAYTAAGKIGASEKAGVYGVLQREARRQLSESAPELFKAHMKLASTLGREKMLKRVINPLTIGAGIIGGGAAALGGYMASKALGREE